MKNGFTFGAGFALMALVAPVGAQAAEANAACISEQEVSALAIYAVPQLIVAIRTTCSGHLSATGFLAANGDVLVRRYAAQKDSIWPLARSALFKMASTRADADDTVEEDPLAMLADLPDNAIRPFVDALVEQEVAKEIEPGKCGSIERMTEALAPLEPAEAGTLVGVIAGLALADDEDQPICPIGPP
jgi:hypothetical protein